MNETQNDMSDWRGRVDAVDVLPPAARLVYELAAISR
jgi:hypothetical protein